MSNTVFGEEKILKARSGFVFLFLVIFLFILSTALFVFMGASFEDDNTLCGVLSLIAACAASIIGVVLCCGLRIIKPNEALVLSLFGRYYGTLYESGYWFINPFCTNLSVKEKSTGVKNNPEGGESENTTKSKSKVSLKISTFVNGNQKVNDRLGNPIEVSAIVMWRVTNATKAVLNVENYHEYLSNQTDSTIRNIARLYPYDIIDDNDDDDDKSEKTLRGSSSLIAEEMKRELEERVRDAGLEIIEVRLNQIAYAPEIAAAMLQRQQAIAVIAARRKIVEGAVSMVKMALDELKSEGVVDLDEERKANMVSNLLVVLCSSKEANPVLNTGSLY